jgi:hypothetical protein
MTALGQAGGGHTIDRLHGAVGLKQHSVSHASAVHALAEFVDGGIGAMAAV